MEQHERFEELAVGHVLGGLTAPDAAAFRSHLLGCRDCRLRVAELRDIAADLAAAEREERAEARVRTEVEQRTAADDDEDHDRPRRLTSRTVGIAIAVAVVVFAALSFWNLHLRTQVAATGLLVERQEAALAELASGVSVAVDATVPVAGIVVVDDDEVAFSFTQLPTLLGTERYVVRLAGTSEDADPVVLIARSEDGRVAGTAELQGAAELLVTIEEGAIADGPPAGRQVASADLTAGQVPAG